MNEENAKDALRHVKEVFDRYGISFCLNSGVLLGAVRDGRIIPWDNDIDLVIWEKDAEKLNPETSAYKELYSRGFELFYLKDKVVIEKGGCPVNALLFRLFEGKAVRGPYPLYENMLGKFPRSIWWILTVSYHEKLKFKKIKDIKIFCKILLVKSTLLLPKGLRKNLSMIMQSIALRFGCRLITLSVPAHFFTNLSTIELYGMEFNAPAETEEFLEFRYGKDWRTPDKKWNTVRDDGLFRV